MDGSGRRESRIARAQELSGHSRLSTIDPSARHICLLNDVRYLASQRFRNLFKRDAAY
jgi:hypothetical protein